MKELESMVNIWMGEDRKRSADDTGSWIIAVHYEGESWK